MKNKFFNFFLRALFACNVLFTCVQNANAQACLAISERGNDFINYALKVRRQLKQGANQDSLIIHLTNSFDEVIKKTDPYNSNPELSKYTKLRCYAMYFNCLATVKDYETIEEFAQDLYTYFIEIDARNIQCEVKDYKKKLIRKIDEDGYEYTTEVTSLEVTGNINISNVAVLQNTGSVYVTMLMALDKANNTTLLNKYFDAAYYKGVWVNVDELTSLTASKYALHDYDENKMLSPTFVNGAVTYLHALKYEKLKPDKGNSKSDILYHDRAKNILLKFLNADFDSTKIDLFEFQLAMIELIKDDEISNVDKAKVLQKQLTSFIYCLNKTSFAGINRQMRRYDEADLFNYTNSKLLQEIWNTNDKQFIKAYIDYASSQYVRFEGVVKDVLYNIYLYARDNGYKKEAKDIYKKKFEKYYKDQYPK